jgi:hypothetical protein
VPRSRWTERLGGVGLAVLYFGVLTPVAWCVRAVRDPLGRSWDADRPGYLEPPDRSRPAPRAGSRRRRFSGRRA